MVPQPAKVEFTNVSASHQNLRAVRKEMRERRQEGGRDGNGIERDRQKEGEYRERERKSGYSFIFGVGRGDKGECTLPP